MQNINRYTVVVQEYFQARVKIWLETVGKTIFKIRHYWLRFEFAASRGQIHAHMLVISDFKDVYRKMSAMKDEKLKAAFLQKWMEDTFNMTTGGTRIENVEIDGTNHPATVSYSDRDQKNDACMCMNTLQCHICSAYCLRTRQHT